MAVESLMPKEKFRRRPVDPQHHFRRLKPLDRTDTSDAASSPNTPCRLALGARPQALFAGTAARLFETSVATVPRRSHIHEERRSWARRTADRTPLRGHRAKNVAISELCCTQGHTRASTHLCGPAIICQLSLSVNRRGL